VQRDVENLGRPKFDRGKQHNSLNRHFDTPSPNSLIIATRHVKNNDDDNEDDGGRGSGEK
jgi:hypothetical protein